MWVWIIILIVSLYSGALGHITRPAINMVHALEAPQLTAKPKRPKAFPESLYVPEEAEIYQYQISSEDASPDSYHIYFMWHEPYPPEKLMAWMQDYVSRYQLEQYESYADEWCPDKEGEWEGIVWLNYWRGDANLIGLKIQYIGDPNGVDFYDTAWGTMSYFQEQ